VSEKYVASTRRFGAEWYESERLRQFPIELVDSRSELPSKLSAFSLALPRLSLKFLFFFFLRFFLSNLKRRNRYLFLSVRKQTAEFFFFFFFFFFGEKNMSYSKDKWRSGVDADIF